MEKIINTFLTNLNPKLCILSTVDSDNTPQSAVMAYAVEEGLSLILSTHDDSRKWKNIESNSSVALVFGWDFKTYNVQYEGKAELVKKNKEIEDIYYSANPFLTRYRDLPQTAYIRVRPTWIRLTDFSVSPPKVQEKTI